MTSTGSTRRRVALLGAQAFALGLTLAWITIPANTIFLERFGSGLLPVTYIAAAAAGAAASTLLARALRSTPLTTVVVRVLAVVAAALAGVWVLLWQADATWLSFGALVLLPIALPIGFMFVVGQAGALLDVRVLKALYPRVIAGFALGFTIGGLAGAPILGLLGGPEQLFLVASLAAVGFLALVTATVRSFPTELSVVEDVPEGEERVTLRSLLANRFVVLIMAFQVLSALETQWLDFMVYDRAAARYPDPDDLAVFVGRFSAIAYGADIVFLLLLAGVLLRRHGLRLGLVANPAVVLAMVIAVIVASVAQGSGTTVVFLLIVAARVSDMVLSDGTTRTSVSAAYQAVPGPQRLAAQANVESLAVPVAIGASGVVLLIVRATVGTDGPALFVVVSVVLALWVGCASVIYASYRQNLLDNLRHRLLEPGDVPLGGAGTADAIERLLSSDDPRDVRLGLQALAASDHPDLGRHLERLALQGREDVHAHVLDRLVATHPERAVAVARDGLAHPHAFVRAAALDALASVGAAHDAPAAADLLDDGDPSVRCAAAAAVSTLGTDADRAKLSATITSLMTSADPTDRRLGADLVGRCTPGPWLDRSRLGDLLRDPDEHVARAALGAVRWPEDDALAPTVAALLERRTLAAAASDALTGGGATALAAVAGAAEGSSPASAHGAACAIRVCRDHGTLDAVAVLQRAAVQHDRDRGLVALRALAHLDADDEARGEWASALVGDEVAHGARVLHALDVAATLQGADPLRRALEDELALVRQRVLAAVAVRLGAEPVSRAAFQLAQDSPRLHALALEWLDVSLVGPERPALALLDPAPVDGARLRTLVRVGAVAPLTAGELLRELVEDPSGTWRRPWLSACAIVAAASLAEPVIDLTDSAMAAAAAAAGSPIDGELLRETAAAYGPGGRLR